MNEKDIAELVVKYFSENLFKIIGILFSSIGSLIAATWFISKSWYKREIEHLKSSKTSECNILHEQINYLTQKLHDNNSYAKGIIEVAKNQLMESKTEFASLDGRNVISEYESKIVDIREQYEEDIAKLTLEKENLYKILKESKTEKTEMLDRLYLIINFSNSIDTEKIYYNKINHCYNELFKKQNEDNFFIIYSKMSVLITNRIIYSFLNLKNEKNKLENRFFNNRINNLNHTIRMIEPFTLNNEKNEYSYNELIDAIRKSLDDLEGDINQTEDDIEK